MSIEAMTACWGSDFPAQAAGISQATVRVVALAVADVVNDAHDNRFFAARRHVARKVGCDPDTVSDVMHHLIEARVVEVVDNRRGKPVEYRWLWKTASGGSPHPLRSTTAPRAVTSPQHKPNRHSKKPAPPSSDGRRDYDHAPLSPEEIALKYGVET